MISQSSVPHDPQPGESPTNQGDSASVVERVGSGDHKPAERPTERAPSRDGWRFVSLEERNRRYAEADALLDEKTKRKHPEVSLADDAFKQRYRDQWVAIAITEVDYCDRIVKGRVFAAARSRRSLFSRIKALREKYPQLAFLDHFTGQFKDTGRIILQDHP